MKRFFLLLVILMMSTHINPVVTEAKTVKYHTIENQLDKNTKKLITKIKSNNASFCILKCSKTTYHNLTKYLYSDYHMYYLDDEIYITDVKLVKNRIKSVEKVNRNLYKQVKKLYRGKRVITLLAYENYIGKTMKYSYLTPDIYYCTERGTCVSYSVMLKVMCDISHIPCHIYAGWMTPKLGHCWNKVKVEGKWFWADACWYDLCKKLKYGYSRKVWTDHLRYKNLERYQVYVPY